MPADSARSAPPLLIVGHGTRDAAGVEQFTSFTRRVAERMAGTGVAVGGGLIELAPPPLMDAVASLVDAGHRHLVAVPLMLVAAGHAKGDIPAAMDRERERHPQLTYAYGRPLAADPRILAALDERLSAVLDDAERAGTHVVLVGRGSTDPDANAEVFRAGRLFAEGRGLAGVESSFISLAQPGVPAALERCRLLGATRVVVLPYFMFAGVLPDRIVSQAEGWAAEHPEVEVRCADLIGDCDLLADVVIARYEEAVAGGIRNNCDTCMYRTPLPGREAKVGLPQAPHDHPDDPAHPHSHGHGHAHRDGHGHSHGHSHSHTHGQPD
ncbi:sirohydrochlorin chelatase [Motilibacter sp. E257]|uniref:Sirohydrochlorin chelatase n=1 Tax=Motilibacter deserti TaxID=2714956 RepID=A0ABX0GXA7_9ACTN|nr:sirohydrochlorin chelatase [Motilibacter deserti]